MKAYPQAEPIPKAPVSGRLNSWKEIAAFFEKDVRTMHRWETERGLPVHRLPGPGRSSVFAYVSELEAWLNEIARLESLPTPAQPQTQFDAESPQSSEPLHPPDAFSSSEAPPVEPQPPSVHPGSLFSLRYIAPLSTAVLLLFVALIVWAHDRRAAASERTAMAASAAGGKPVINPAAQDLYRRGRYLWNLRTEASLTQAVDMFTQSIVLDPRFSPAYAGLADSYILLRQYGHMPDSEAFPRALNASRQALAIDDESPEAHRTYAFLLTYWLWNFPAADQEFRRAIALDPDDAQTHHWYATSLFSAGKYKEALEQIDIARRLDPNAIAVLADRGLLLGSVDPEAATVYLQQVATANPKFPSVHVYLADVYFSRGKYQEFLEEEIRASTLHNDKAAMAVQHAAQEELARRGSAAMFRALAQGYGNLVDRGYPDAMTPSSFFIRVGDTDQALRYLTLACKRHEAYFLGVDQNPGFRSLYSDPRFQALVAWRRTPISPADPMPTCSASDSAG